MRVAVARAWPDGRDIAALAGAAAARQADLLVMPEADPATAAEASDGPWARSIAASARQHRLAIVAGYREACVTGVYGAALLVDADGICLASYRQTHVPPAMLTAQARGSWLTTMPLAGRRLGLLIGYDLAFPEPALCLALAGCDLLVTLGGVSDGGAGLVLPARARDSGCPLAHAGPDACLLAADGSPAGAVAAGSDLLVAELGPPAAPPADRRMGRRHQLYRVLLEGAEDESRPA